MIRCLTPPPSAGLVPRMRNAFSLLCAAPIVGLVLWGASQHFDFEIVVLKDRQIHGHSKLCLAHPLLGSNVGLPRPCSAYGR